MRNVGDNDAPLDSYQFPDSGWCHFYTPIENEVTDNLLCQCPMSGWSHFYLRKRGGETLRDMVSMPYVGLEPFLHREEWEGDGIHQECQCPMSGWSHFYPTSQKPSVYAGSGACLNCTHENGHS